MRLYDNGVAEANTVVLADAVRLPRSLVFHRLNELLAHVNGRGLSWERDTSRTKDKGLVVGMTIESKKVTIRGGDQKIVDLALNDSDQKWRKRLHIWGHHSEIAANVDGLTFAALLRVGVEALRGIHPSHAV